MKPTVDGTPPFRAEVIGSMLRSEELKQAREHNAAGKVSDEELREIEDDEIRAAVALQEKAGLEVVTDGELRRRVYFGDFYVRGLGGISIDLTGEHAWDYVDVNGHHLGAPLPRVYARPLWREPILVREFDFLSSITDRTPKITIPSPVILHFFGGRANISRDVYPNLDLFWSDIVDGFHKELAALGTAGCNYVQIDETSLAGLSDPSIRAHLKERGDDWQDLAKLYPEVINAVIDGRPSGMHVGLHVCRGNNQGHWQAEGGYETIADALFNKIKADFYFLEYDTPRAGSFEPLAMVPAGKKVVLGLVSTKTPETEPKAKIVERIGEAEKFIKLDQLGISPQCGFASDFRGNPITVDDQAAKLALVVEVAREVWGS